MNTEAVAYNAFLYEEALRQGMPVGLLSLIKRAIWRGLT